jgi:short subunit dehydrogenase-like uncharacterized protein
VALIAVLGAAGLTGRLVVAELLRRGHEVRAAGPDPTALHERLAPLEGSWRAHDADASRPATLVSLLDGVDALVAAAGPGTRLGPPVVEAALHARVHYLDATLDPRLVAWAYEHDERARAAGLTAVPGAGFPTVPLDLLAHLAHGAVTGGDELHLALTAPTRGGLRAGAGPGARGELARLLAAPVVSWVGGGPEEEPVAEARRLAWFPRPVGPAHAAGVPAVPSVSVPRHVASVDVVRTYLALPSWRAELLQMAGNAARWEPARRRLERWVTGAGVEPTARRRDEVRWAAVAETHGREGVARAWANGRDPAGLPAAAITVLLEAILEDGAPRGVLAPAQVGPAGDLLDDLAARGALRWSISRPGRT